MINRNKFKIVIYICVGIVLLIGVFAIFNSIKDKHIKEAVEARVVKEMELKQLKKEYEARVIVLDSLKAELAKSLAIIEYQKKYPQVIIKKYEVKRDSINSLSPNDAYKLFTSNLAKYKYNRERYDMARFKR